MVKILRAVVITSGLLVIIIPIAISLLWTKYLQEHQETQQSADQIGKCTPYDFLIKSDADEKVSVSWRTTDNCTGYVIISPEKGDFSSVSQKVIPFQGSNATTYFMVQIPRAEATNNPYMVIMSNGTMYGLNENSIKIASGKD